MNISLQIFFYVCVCLQDFMKIVRLLLAAVSINGFNIRSSLGIEPLIYKCFDNKMEIQDSFTKKEGEL